MLRLSVFFALLLSCTVASAQISGHFAVKAGAGLSSLRQTGETSFVSKGRVDLQFGGLYRLRVNRFVVQPEILFSQKGGVLKNNTSGAQRGAITKMDFQYISVPVLFGYIPTEGITLQAGPEFSYALSTTAANNPSVRNDFGIAVGAHYDFLDLLSKFSLHVRYVHGFTNVSKIDIVQRYNSVLQAGIVYNFYKKEKRTAK
ncbi:porin family protein [Tellurirhabdus rosea]|uniref:porin family protein n=1 Tax=Tellurirhabdus rosea TaxID=2674997 RepID=UPI0022556711|nr:porin family protein [Tellurirhabdus rosea]